MYDALRAISGEIKAFRIYTISKFCLHFSLALFPAAVLLFSSYLSIITVTFIHFRAEQRTNDTPNTLLWEHAKCLRQKATSLTGVFRWVCGASSYKESLAMLNLIHRYIPLEGLCAYKKLAHNQKVII